MSDPIPQRDHVHALPAAPASPASKVASAAPAFFALAKSNGRPIATAAPDRRAGLKGPTRPDVRACHNTGAARFIKIFANFSC